MTPIEAAFQRFKNKHYTAVQIDTEAGQCDYGNAKFFRLEKRVKQAWADAVKAEQELRELFPK